MRLQANKHMFPTLTGTEHMHSASLFSTRLPGKNEACSMPCPVITEGFRQELLATYFSLLCRVAFVPRRDPVDSVHWIRGWLSTRCKLPGFHHPRLAVTFTNVYSSLAATASIRYVKFMVWKESCQGKRTGDCRGWARDSSLRSESRAHLRK